MKLHSTNPLHLVSHEATHNTDSPYLVGHEASDLVDLRLENLYGVLVDVHAVRVVVALYLSYRERKYQ